MSRGSLRTTRRCAVTIVAVSLGALAALPAAAQSAAWPDKPVRVIANVSVAETVGRLVAPRMTEILGRPVIVESVFGAAGNIGADRVAKAPPDGYTFLLSGDAALTTNVTLVKDLPYDPVKAFAPVSLLVDSVNVLVVHPDVPARSVAELVALARAKPGTLGYGSGGNGTSQHLGGALLRTMAQIDIVHIPYKGSPMQDLLGGRVPMVFGNVAAVTPFVKDGRLRALAVSSLQRAPGLPDVPTVAESGYPGFEATAWFGLVAPAATPTAIVGRMGDAARAAVRTAGLREKLVELGFTPLGTDAASFGERIRAEIPKKGRLVAESGAVAN